MIFGADVKTIGFIKITKGEEFGGAIITPLQIVIIVVSLVLLVILWLFMKKLKLVKQCVLWQTIRIWLKLLVFLLNIFTSGVLLFGSLIAGIAGILVGLEQNLEPTMGTNLIIKGFTGAIVGGIGSVPGSILGAFLIGIVENFGIWFLPSGYKDAIAFIYPIYLFTFPTARNFGSQKEIVRKLFISKTCLIIKYKIFHTMIITT